MVIIHPIKFPEFWESSLFFIAKIFDPVRDNQARPYYRLDLFTPFTVQQR